MALQLTGNQITISAQDLDFSISAYERLNCLFEGDDMEIGFRIDFPHRNTLKSILAGCGVGFSDPSRAGLVTSQRKGD